MLLGKRDQAMTSMFGHNIRSELLILYVSEAVGIFMVAYALMYWGAGDGAALDQAEILLLAAILSLAAGLASGASGLYVSDILTRPGLMAVRGAVATFLFFLGAWAALGLIIPHGSSISSASLAALLTLGAITGGGLIRLLHAYAARNGWLRPRLLLIRDPESPSTHAQQLALAAATLDAFEVGIARPTGARVAEALRPEWLRAQQFWAVVAPDGAADASLRRHCRAAGLRVLTEDEFLECRLNRVACDRLPKDWLTTARSVRENRVEAVLRRSFDITVATVLLLVTLPVSLVAALAVRLDSKGPVFYRQERSGLHGRTFTLFKFRSMVVDAEAGGKPVWATKSDPRVTPVGRFMRLTRIDELPQLFNVLRGDMSVVGPRPERPGFVEQLGGIIPHYNDRALVKPGITGWAQVNYPYGASIEDARMKLAYDLYYVRRRSLFLDLVILVATVRVVLFQEGAR